MTLGLQCGTEFSFRWRQKCYGLNVEEVCQNDHCAAYGQKVADSFGEDHLAFNMLGDKAHCPSCHTSFVPKFCGFAGCMWAVDGCRDGANGPEDYSADWMVCTENFTQLCKGSIN